MSVDPHYSDEEAEQILRLATHRSASGVSRDRLLQMAEELGLSPEAVRGAEEQVVAEREDKLLRREYANYCRRNLISGLWSFISVNAFLLIFDYYKDHRLSWSLLCLAAWLIGLISQVVSTFAVNTDKYEASYRAWLEKRNSPQKQDGNVNIVIGAKVVRENLTRPGDEIDRGPELEHVPIDQHHSGGN